MFSLSTFSSTTILRSYSVSCFPHCRLSSGRSLAHLSFVKQSVCLLVRTISSVLLLSGQECRRMRFRSPKMASSWVFFSLSLWCCTVIFFFRSHSSICVAFDASKALISVGMWVTGQRRRGGGGHSCGGGVLSEAGRQDPKHQLEG